MLRKIFFIGWLIFMASISYADGDSIGYEIDVYGPYVVEMNVYPKNKYMWDIEIKNRYFYVLDGYLVYDIIYDKNITPTVRRSVFELRPVVYRGYIPIYLKPFEEENITLEISPKNLGLKKGGYYVKLYIFKDRLNIVGNYISFISPFIDSDIHFNIEKDHGPVPSAYFNKEKSHFLGGYGQAGPLIYTNRIEDDDLLDGYLEITVLDEDKLFFSIDIYVCEWSDMGIFAENVKTNCEYLSTYNVSGDKRGIVFSLKKTDIPYSANQIVYILKDEKGRIHDIFESRAITPHNQINLISMNYVIRDNVFEYEVAFTGPYYPYIQEINNTEVSICVNDFCDNVTISSLSTDKIEIIGDKVNISTDNIEEISFCVIVEDYINKCKFIPLIEEESSEESSSTRIYLLLFFFAIIFLLISFIYYSKNKVVHKK